MDVVRDEGDYMDEVCRIQWKLLDCRACTRNAQQGKSDTRSSDSLQAFESCNCKCEAWPAHTATNPTIHLVGIAWSSSCTYARLCHGATALRSGDRVQ